MSSAPDGIVALRFLSVVPNITAEHMDRQRELLTATARTEQHPGIRGMHLLVLDALQARGMLAAHGYTLGRHVTISELGRWPLNSDLVEYASTVLRGQWVLASNDDVYPEGDAWLRPPDGALMLSRHAKERETCDGCLRSCNAMRRTPHTSLCNRANVGSFDAWVHRFSSPVTNATDPVATAMLATPRHSFGADNLLGHVRRRPPLLRAPPSRRHAAVPWLRPQPGPCDWRAAQVFEEHLGVPLRNRCHHYKLFHLHCRLTTSDAKNGRQSGKRRGYGEGFRTGVHNHGDMARLIMRHDPQKHSWNEARTIVRKQWPPE